MRRTVVAGGILASYLMTSTALAEPAFVYGGEAFLVQDKFMVGPRIGIEGSTLGFLLEMVPVFSTLDDPPAILDGRFVGMLFGGQLTAKLTRISGASVHVGLGCDYYGMWGIYSEEYHIGMPISLEVRGKVGRELSVFSQLRTYLVSDEGLELGVDRQGSDSIPVMFVVGIGGGK